MHVQNNAPVPNVQRQPQRTTPSAAGSITRGSTSRHLSHTVAMVERLGAQDLASQPMARDLVRVSRIENAKRDADSLSKPFCA